MTVAPALSLFELRRYRLRPGTREALIALFDAEFVETQEACGMAVLAQFRDLDDPDAFVWMRGFADLPARLVALQGFYGGPVWARHAPAARATMVNTADCLLLRPAGAAPAFAAPAARPAPGAIAPASGAALVTVHHLTPGREAAFAELAEAAIRPRLAAGPGRLVATLATDPGPNDFAPLPVRPDPVFVTLETFPDAAALAQALGERAGPDWMTEMQPEIDRLCWRPARVMRLAATGRSALRG